MARGRKALRKTVRGGRTRPAPKGGGRRKLQTGSHAHNLGPTQTHRHKVDIEGTQWNTTHMIDNVGGFYPGYEPGVGYTGETTDVSTRHYHNESVSPMGRKRGGRTRSAPKRMARGGRTRSAPKRMARGGRTRPAPKRMARGGRTNTTPARKMPHGGTAGGQGCKMWTGQIDCNANSGCNWDYDGSSCY